MNPNKRTPLNEELLESVSGGIDPQKVGSLVGQYDVQPGETYYLHVTMPQSRSTNAEQYWREVTITSVYEEPVFIVFSRRKATYIYNGKKEVISLDNPKLYNLYEING